MKETGREITCKSVPKVLRTSLKSKREKKKALFVMFLCFVCMCRYVCETESAIKTA
jgi:hypothetical protein